MKYEHITEGRFIDRPNRFIAHVEINGQVQGASDPGYTGFSGKEQQSGEKDSL